MKINLRSLSRSVAQKLGIPESRVEGVLKAFIHEIGDRMKSGQTVHLKNFGTFFIKNHNGRSANSPNENPRTQGIMKYGKTVMPRVKFSSILKKFLRKGVISVSKNKPKAEKKKPAKPAKKK